MTGPRAFVLLIPDVPLMNANDRQHWRQKRALTAGIRQATAFSARNQGIPHLDRAHIVAEYLPPDRRRRDPANWAPSAKAAVDGLVDAAVFDDDDHTRVVGPDMRLGELAYILTGHHRPRLLLRITELLNQEGTTT